MMEFSVFDTLEIGTIQYSPCLSLEEGMKLATNNAQKNWLDQLFHI